MSAADDPAERKSQRARDAGGRGALDKALIGFFLLTGVHGGMLLLGLAFVDGPVPALRELASAMLMGFAVTHLAWSLPLIVVASVRRLPRLRTGMLVSAALATLAGSACWGLVLYSM